jgi:hypothetical protein
MEYEWKFAVDSIFDSSLRECSIFNIVSLGIGKGRASRRRRAARMGSIP